jgi:zinc protease
MNTVMGGSFTSRLNTILRERMGVTYGASSRFRMRRSGGLFMAGAAISTEAAARSAEVIIEEMERMRSELVPEEELVRAQSYIALGLPRSFETTSDIVSHVRDQLLYGLPADYWQTYVDRVFAVTAADVRDAAARHLQPETATVVIVADRHHVQSALERSRLGEIQLTSVET